MKIGFIGLGNMGSAIAMNLLKAGHELTVYNRSAEKAKPLLRQGARAAASPAETCGGDVVFTMLADDHAVESVTFGESGILANLRPGSVHISSSTISVALSQKLTAAHEKHNQRFISAPIFGRPEAAEAGKLFVVVAGPDDAVERCTSMFEVIGQRTFRFGEQPSARQFDQAQREFPDRISI
jgi:3-hydroxyisobutyrate dehydrogenase-like beta-hydroxyacid dehydrogenase